MIFFENVCFFNKTNNITLVLLRGGSERKTAGNKSNMTEIGFFKRKFAHFFDFPV